MFKAMMEGIREETVEQVFANAQRFDEAAARAEADGTAQAAATVAAADASGRLGLGRAKQGGTVLGSTGQEAMNERVTYSAPDEDGSSTVSAGDASGAGSPDASSDDGGAAEGANRAERRAAKKKAKKRRSASGPHPLSTTTSPPGPSRGRAAASSWGGATVGRLP